MTANQFTSAAGVEPAKTSVENGIYYYDDANGVRTWLRRDRLYTQGNPLAGSDNTGIRYEVVCALEPVRFSQARSFEHLNYCLWTGLKEQAG